MLRKFSATGIAMLILHVSFAQDIAVTATTGSSSQESTENTPAEEPKSDKQEEEKKPSFIFSGSADVYYRYDLHKQASNNKTSFTNSHNSFELGMASVKLEHSKGKVSAVADIGFGKRAEDFSYNDDKSRFALKQLYLSYNVLDNLKITAGSWATHVGYELVDAYANRNYSMSYMFSYGPFFHTGVKAELSVGRNGFMLGVANPTDLKSTTLEHKYVIGQYSTSSANDKIKAYINFLSGKPDNDTKQSQLDAVLTGAVSDVFSIGVNGTVATMKLRESSGKFGSSDSWYGTALYLNYDPVSWMGFSFRNEYFNDKKQLNVFSGAAEGGDIFASTLSANFTIDNLKIIPEFRYETASSAIFTDASGGAIKNSASILVAAVYAF